MGIVEKMGFDVGTVIYIIITIVAIIASTTKKKKQAASRKATGSTSKPGGLFSKIEEQLAGMIDEAKTSVQSVADELIPGESIEEPVLQTEQDSSLVQEAYSEFSQQEDINIEEDPFLKYEGVFNTNRDLITSEGVRTTSKENIDEVIAIDEELDPGIVDIVHEFDLRKAVIYSTILNRIEY